MPISVVCPSCKARFNVSEKFAGQKGPCPKCKAPIVIPAVQEEVKVHVPEQFQSGGKDSKGRAVSKPLLREETKVTAIGLVSVIGASIMVLGVAVLVRFFVTDKLPVAAVGAVLLAAPLCIAAYSFLRNQELEAYTGKSLYLRAALCGLAYALLWAAYYPLPLYGIITGEPWQWVFVAPVFIGVGAGVAWACFDLDFGSAAMHYCFYLMVTLALRFVIGMPPLWEITSTTP